jgi:predicted anti-sigma-YlaC factor YlaD
MSGLTCRDVKLSLGVYVVGAIDPADRALVDAHLSHCLECREELAGLAGLPALLGRVPAAEAERLTLADTELRGLEEPSPEMLRSLLGQVAARRKARRWRVLAAAAAAVVIAVGGGVASGMAVYGHRSQQPIAQAAGWPQRVQATSATTHVTADVDYATGVAGTAMSIRVSDVRPGTTCEFWVMDSNGQRWLAASWTVTAGHEPVWYQAHSLVPPASVAGFQLTSGKTLLVDVPAS